MTGRTPEEIAARVAKRVEQRHGTTIMYDAADILIEEILLDRMAGALKSIISAFEVLIAVTKLNGTNKELIATINNVELVLQDYDKNKE